MKFPDGRHKQPVLYRFRLGADTYIGEAVNFHQRMQRHTPQGNRCLKKRDNQPSGQGYAKIDGIIACINAVHLVDEFEPRDFNAAGLIG